MAATSTPDFLRVRAEALFVYPIKSCAGLRVPRLQFTAQGTIQDDRAWVVVDAGSTVVWQGSHPRLALVRPALRDSALVLNGPDDASIEAPSAGRPCDFHLWNDATKQMETHPGTEAGPPVAAFLQRVTGAELRLVRLESRTMARDSANPVHLINAASLEELNRVLVARGAKPAEALRFRPNIILGGAESSLAPFAEERFSRLRWSENSAVGQITISGPCVRCIVPNVDLVTAEVTAEPAKTVASMSTGRFPGEPSYFGLYGRPTQSTTLAEGTVMEAELKV